MIRYLKLLFAKGMKSYLENQTIQFIFFFDHTFHTHMSTYFQTQDIYQNIHCKQTADNKSNNKIAFMNAWAHLLSIEVVVHQFKVEVWFVYTSIDGLSLSCSRTVNLGRLVKVRQLNATTLKKRDYWWWRACLWVFYQIALWFLLKFYFFNTSAFSISVMMAG